MSLAMYAAPFDNNNILKNNEEETTIAKKRVSHNKTQKIHPKEMYTSKVENIINTLHNLPDEPDDSGLGDFKPLAPPTSVGVEQTKLRDNNKTPENQDSFDKYTKYAPSGVPNVSNAHPDPKYDRFMPNYNSFVKNISPNDHTPQTYYNGVGNLIQNDNDILIEKLNYMISLLEEQQDEKTNNVTEELILYSFLGIFIIFLVDSFVRVGKYVR